MSALPGGLFDVAIATGAVGAGVTGGVLFGFSTFVMAALDRLPSDRAIEAMQSINRHAPNPWFMGAMFGTASVATVLGVGGIARSAEPDGAPLALGAACYLASVLVTVGYHVPRNRHLAGIVTPCADAAACWDRYRRGWTAANHARAALAIAAAALFTTAASLRASS